MSDIKITAYSTCKEETISFRKALELAFEENDYYENIIINSDDDDKYFDLYIATDCIEECVFEYCHYASNFEGFTDLVFVGILQDKLTNTYFNSGKIEYNYKKTQFHFGRFETYCEQFGYELCDECGRYEENCDCDEYEGIYTNENWINAMATRLIDELDADTYEAYTTNLIRKVFKAGLRLQPKLMFELIGTELIEENYFEYLD